MSFKDLAAELARMYDSAPRGDKTTMVLLFAIKYADELEKLENYNMVDLVQAANMPKPYATEINKGRRLSKYVLPKA